MNRQMIIDHLALAEIHVAEGKLIVEGQRRRVAEHICKGRPIDVSEALLEQFENCLAMHIADRDRLQKALEEMADGPAAARRLNEQAKEFRRKAAECDRLAEASSDNFIAGEY